MTSAIIYSFDNDNRPLRCRALLDTCSSANFVTENLARTLRLPRKKCSIPVNALNDLTTIAKSIIKIKIRSINTDYEKTLTFLTVPRIADLIPNERFPRDILEIPSNIQLADPNFYEPAPIDILLGCGPSLSMFCAGQLNLSRDNHEIILQQTQLGWIIGGNIASPNMKNTNTSTKCHLSDIQATLSKFWELEHCPEQIHLSAEAIACENHFRKYTTRKQSGQYILALPFRQNIELLGKSRSRALKRLNNSHRRFQHQPELEKQYNRIFEEYLELGHMSPVKDENEFGFYLPHQAVFKESSLTTQT